MNERQIIEAIEACRPNSDDLQDLDMSALADVLDRDTEMQDRSQRIQAWDATLATAMDDVAVPEGLADRLLDVLHHDEPKLPNITDAVELADSAEGSTVTPARKASARRYWLGRVAAAVSVAALVLIAVAIFQTGTPTPQDSAEFAAEVIGWSEELGESQWNRDFSAPEVQKLRIDRSVRAVPRRWSQIDTPYATQAVVLDLTPPRGQEVYLFAFPSKPGQKIPSTPPATPFSTTGGFAIGMWQRDGVVYVLAVRGGERRYSSLIRTSVILG